MTKKQKQNLLKLVKYLEQPKLDAKFNMVCYGDETITTSSTDCGSVGCAVGHGPYAGIRKFKSEDWYQYSRRVFGLNYNEWIWCFDDLWIYLDNTPKGAAARIRLLLEKGLPSNYWEQMTGKHPLCY